LSTERCYDPETFNVTDRERTQRASQVLKAFLKEIKQDGKVGIFLYIPGIVEVNGSLWAVAVKSHKQPLQRDLPRNFLISAAREAGFDCVIDPLEEPDGRDRLTQGYFPLDMHLNQAGNVYIGELLAQKIRAMYLQGRIPTAEPPAAVRQQQVPPTPERRRPIGIPPG
jgi:hypothetical protein